MTKLEQLLYDLCPDGVEYRDIGDIAEVGTGSSNGNEAIDDGAYPFFVRSQTIKAKDDYEYDEEAIIIPGEGGIGEIFHYVNGKYALHQRVYRIHFIIKDVNIKLWVISWSQSCRHVLSETISEAGALKYRRQRLRQHLTNCNYRASMKALTNCTL